MTAEQESAIVECLNDLTVSVQLLASRLVYEAGQDAVEAFKRVGEANIRLFEAFPEYREPEKASS